MAKRLTYKRAQGIILDALEKWDWAVKRRLKVPHATDPYNRVRLYFKPQAIYFDKGAPFSLGSARSLHLDPRDLAIFHWVEIRDRLVKETDYYANPKRKTKKRGKLPTRLPPGTKITRVPPGRAEGAELPHEYVHTSGEYRSKHHPDPAAEWTYRRRPNPEVRRWIGAGFEGTWQYHWAETIKGWRVVIESSSGITYWPVQTQSGDIVGWDYHQPKRGSIPVKVLKKAKTVFKKGWKEYAKSGNPMPGVPGGGIAECIEEMSTRPDVDDPGALCAWIAQQRGEFGWRSLPRRLQKRKSPERRKALGSVMRKALR